MRHALGAGRGDVVRGFLVETALLAGAGGALGVVLGWWGGGQVHRLAPSRPPYWAARALDARVVAFTVAVTALERAGAGIVPASRAGREGLVDDLKEGGRGTTGGARGRLGRLLAVSELAAALVLVVGAALMVQSFERRYGASTPARRRRVVTARLALAGDAYREPRQRAEFVEELSAGSGRSPRSWPRARPTPFRSAIPSRAAGSRGRSRSRGSRWSRGARRGGLLRRDPGLHRRGRRRRRRRPAVLARGGSRGPRGRPGERGARPPLSGRRRGGSGGRVRLAGGPWLRIVGVTRDMRDAGDMTEDDTKPPEQVYVPYRTYAPADVALAVRTRSDPLRFAERCGPRSVRWTPRCRCTRCSRWTRSACGRPGWPGCGVGMLSHVAVLALVLAVLGVYGVVAYSCRSSAPRDRDPRGGGGPRGEILRLVLGDGLRLAAQAVAWVCWPGLLTRSLARLLYGVGALDPATLAGCALALVFATLVASGGPAWRGARVDPVVALRAE